MTTLTSTNPTSRPTDQDLAPALDGLAAAAGQARDDARTRAVLAVVVQRLEDAAGAGLGDAGSDPLVVLQRRFGRAHAPLTARPEAHLDPGLLLGLGDALQGSERETATERRPAPAGCPLPAAC